MAGVHLRKICLQMIGLLYLIKTMWKYALIYFLASIIAIGTLSYLLKESNTEKARYKANTESLQNGIKQYQLDSSKWVTETSRLEMSIGEFKAQKEQYMKTIKELNVRVRQLQSVSDNTIVVDAKIDTVLDTEAKLNKLEGKPYSVHSSDKYKDLNFIINNDSINGNVYLTANLIQYIYTDYRHKFLWFMWGMKGVKQVIICDNPYVKINYSSYLEIKKSNVFK